MARNRATSTVDSTVESTEESTVETGKAVMPLPNYDVNTLRDLDSFAAAIDLVGEAFGSVDDASDVLGDGFKLLNKDDKARLVGKPMVLLEWSFYPSEEHGGEFCALRLVSQEEKGVGKYIVNDGSTGLARMLKEFTARTGKSGGLLVRKGFRMSDYAYCDDCRMGVSDDHRTEEPDHKLGRAKTYYIDTSA